MLRHRLRRAAWLLAPWRSQRDRLDFYHGLLSGRHEQAKVSTPPRFDESSLQ